MAVLETAMKAKSWNDDDLAREVGISRVHASRLRRRICLPSPELAKRLEQATEIPAERFIFEERAA
jgi:transcriptional regulator with XRE-family HTH domain